MDPRDLRVHGRPVNFEWMGWRSDSLTLARNGWGLSARQDPMRRTMAFALRHKDLQVEAVSNVAMFDFERVLNDPRTIDQYPVSFTRFAHNMHISVNHPTEFRAIDPYPSSGYDYTIHDMKDLIHFREVTANTAQIVLEKSSLREVLDIALEKQFDKQQEIRMDLLDQKKAQEYSVSELQAELRLAV